MSYSFAPVVNKLTLVVFPQHKMVTFVLFSLVFNFAQMLKVTQVTYACAR